MAAPSSSSSCFVLFLLLLHLSFLTLAASAETASGSNSSSFSSFQLPAGEQRLHSRVRAHLRRLNKPPLKTIKSPDGDLIDCVPAHRQPAFDHPLLRGQRPLEPPERPRVSRNGSGGEAAAVVVQKWQLSGESCPEGTVPVRRTTEEDLLRATSLRRFARKAPAAGRRRFSRTRRDSTSGGHEHAVGFVSGGEYYGARASLNVWSPRVGDPSEFSLSQIWVISGTFGDDLNTIEAGWQVSPELYGDDSPRFFTYWTSDAYQTTGCYNHNCMGFVQTSNKIAIGASITPTSFYDGQQFDITLLIWKDPRHEHWWLELGGEVIGYWPSFLFTHLAGHATMVQFGGEVVNSQSAAGGPHTATQMGSGHFPGEGFDKAAYFRQLQVVDWDNGLLPASGLQLLADRPACYDIRGGVNRPWGSYFYYGGPGRNPRCP